MIQFPENINSTQQLSKNHQVLIQFDPLLNNKHNHLIKNQDKNSISNSQQQQHLTTFNKVNSVQTQTSNTYNEEIISNSLPFEQTVTNTVNTNSVPLEQRQRFNDSNNCNTRELRSSNLENNSKIFDLIKELKNEIILVKDQNSALAKELANTVNTKFNEIFFFF